MDHPTLQGVPVPRVGVPNCYFCRECIYTPPSDTRQRIPLNTWSGLQTTSCPAAWGGSRHQTTTTVAGGVTSGGPDELEAGLSVTRATVAETRPAPLGPACRAHYSTPRQAPRTSPPQSRRRADGLQRLQNHVSQPHWMPPSPTRTTKDELVLDGESNEK